MKGKKLGLQATDTLLPQTSFPLSVGDNREPTHPVHPAAQPHHIHLPVLNSPGLFMSVCVEKNNTREFLLYSHITTTLLTRWVDLFSQHQTTFCNTSWVFLQFNTILTLTRVSLDPTG